MAVMFVYVTAADAAEAERIGRAWSRSGWPPAPMSRRHAVDLLVAGQGGRRASEAVLILKTTEERLEALMARVKELHSYECPCIEALPVVAGHQPFLDWVAQETHGSPAAESDDCRMAADMAASPGLRRSTG